MGEDKMRDTLDLTQLAAEIDQRKRLTKQVIRLNCGLFLGIFLLPIVLLFGMAAALISGNKGLADLCKSVIDRGTFLILVVPFIAYLSYGWLLRQWVRLARPHMERLTTLLGEPFNLREPAGFLEWFIVVAWIVIILASAIRLISVDTFVIVGLSLFFAFFVYRMTQIRMYLWGPLSRADYDGAMRLNQLFLQLNSRDNFLRYCNGYITYLSGRLNSLDAILRDNLRRSQTTIGSVQYFTVNLMMLANERMEHDDFTTARQLLESAAHINPVDGNTYFSLAELYLRHEQEPERALELIDFGLSQLPVASKRNADLQRSSRAWLKFIEAQACWLTGRVTRCNTAVELALDLIDPRHKPLTAHAYVALGRLRQMQGETAEARDYCQKALAIDPHGLAGQYARKLLDQLENSSSAENPPAVR